MGGAALCVSYRLFNRLLSHRLHSCGIRNTITCKYLPVYRAPHFYNQGNTSELRRCYSSVSRGTKEDTASLSPTMVSISGVSIEQKAIHDLTTPGHEVEYCNEILSDPVSDVSLEESRRFVIPYPNNDRTYLFDALTRPFRRSYMFEPASVMIQLCVERLENNDLTNTFAIGLGFNRRAYFLFLHVWLLHRRAMKESPLGILLDRYLFSCAFELLSEWLLKRNIPEHRFKRERENCQSFMMKFLVELDQCTLDEEVYAYKISRTLHYHMYEEDVDDRTLSLLVKYVLRQFSHISNLESRHFLDAMFLWADHESICEPRRLLKRAMPQLIKYGGYQGPQTETADPALGPSTNKTETKLGRTNTKAINEA